MFELKVPRTEKLPDLRVTPEEKRLFAREARRRGLTPSNLLRLAVGHVLAEALQDPKRSEDAIRT